MGYDRDDSFPFDFEPNEIPFGAKSRGELSPRSYPIQCERKWKHSFLSLYHIANLSYRESVIKRDRRGILQSNKYILTPIQIDRDVIVVTIYFFITNQIKFRLNHNEKKLSAR